MTGARDGRVPKDRPWPKVTAIIGKEEANQQLCDPETKLASIIAMVAELEETLTKLTGQYKATVEEKIKCQELADSTSNTISLANRLVGGLASGNIRWSRSVKDLQSMLRGDILLSASFISYLGAFTKQ